MKRLFLPLILFSAFLSQQAGATQFLPYLNAIRSEIINQQVIVSNAPTLDKKLATALRKARTALDRTTPTNLVNDTKTLATVAATLNKSSLSNQFDGLIRSAIVNYAGTLASSLNTISNALLTTFPSGPHTAVNNLIAQVFDGIDAALAKGNTTLVTKALAAITKKLPTIQNLLTKAINAPPGANVVSASINGAGFKSASRTTIGTYTPASNQAIIAGVAGVKGLTIWTLSATPGTTTHTIGDQGSDAYAIYFNGLAGQAVSTSGTLTITVDTTHNVMYGTFSFTANGPTLGNLSVNSGSFLVSF